MANTEQREHVALAPFYGKHSMEAWTHALLEDRCCLDCKAAIEGFAGAMVFSGPLPQTDLVGHLCEACWQRRKEVRLFRQRGR